VGNEKLFNLTVHLHALEMKYEAKVIITHVSDERMKAQGMDGASQEQPKEGVAIGHNMLSYIPFDETCLERSLKLEKWIRSWVAPTVEFLEPEGWFKRGHDVLGGDYNAKGLHSKYRSGNFCMDTTSGCGRSSSRTTAEGLNKATRLLARLCVSLFNDL